MAKFRPHKSRRGPLPFRYVILLTIVFFIFSTVGGILIANKGLKPTLVRYAESQNRSMAANAVSYAIENLKDKNLQKEMIKTVQNNEGNIASVSVDPVIGNTFTAQIQQDIQSFLDGAAEGKIKGYSDLKKSPSGELVYSVPLGRATGNVILGNIGPDIPIELHLIGDTEVNMTTEYGETGINGTLVNIKIDVIVNVQTIIPFATKVKPYPQTITLPGGVYNMGVPEYYNGNGESSPPSIQLDGDKDSNKKDEKDK